MRRCQDWRRRIRFAVLQQPEPLPARLIQHRSALLRRLVSTDPQLLRNKVVNLRLALPSPHGLLIRLGETLSIWRRIGSPSARRAAFPG